MLRIHSISDFIYLILLTITLCGPAIAAEDIYSSQLVNDSNHKHTGNAGFRLIKTRMWPNNDCLLDTGKAIINPGDSTALKIKKDIKCSDSGVGYEIYASEDTNKQHLLGYLSHRLGDGKFSLQISRFCEGTQCVFYDLNPEQHRK